jgi:parallel beta-helix repeat protein
VLLTALRTDAIGGNEFINLKLRRSAARVTSYRTNGFYVQSPNNLVEGCDMVDLNGFGIQTYNGNSPRAEPDNNVFRYNVIHDFPVTTEKTQGIDIGQGSGNKVYGNVVFNLKGTVGGSQGIYVYRGANIEVYNNTVYGNASGGIVVDPGVTGAIVRNNISYQNSGGDYRNGGTNTFASNNLIGVNPMFVNPSAGDFKLLSGSPAVDAGTTISMVLTDVIGTPRPQGSAYDVGAFELATGSDIPVAPTGVRIVSN